MAPIKFENNIKDKLEKRTIQPSSDVWNALSDRLDKQEKRNNKNLFWWLGIAASLVGVVLVTSLFFNDHKIENNQPVIVDSEQELIKNHQEDLIDKAIALELPETKETIVLTEEKTESNRAVEIFKKHPLKENRFNLKDVIKDPENNASIAQTSPRGMEVALEERPIKEQSFEDLKVQTVIAEIKKMNAESSGVSDRDIDSLLKQAEKEIITNRLYNKTTRTVDANALLQDVEVALEQSFRAKVFDALKNGYSTVKTAVAERNN